MEGKELSWLQQLSEWLASAKCWYTVRPWERAIRVRCGKWVERIEPGIHLRLPFFDQVFTQNIRQRVLNLPVQTATTSQGKTVTISAVVKWRIADVRQMYEQLQNPEDWIYNTVLSAIADAIYSASDHLITPGTIGEIAEKAMSEASTEDVGIEIDQVSVTDFAIVRTYRLISGEGNTGWSWNRVGSLDTPIGK